MLRNYVTPGEMKLRHSGIAKLIPNDDEFEALVASATSDVISDLGDRGDKASVFQTPIMFESSLKAYEAASYTTGHTSSLVDGKSARRLVVDCTVAPSDTTTVTLEGTYGTEAGTDEEWIPIRGMDGSPVSIEVQDAREYSEFFMPAVSYRFKTSGETFTGRVYLVGERVQDLIRYKFLYLLLESLNRDEALEKNFEDYGDSYIKRLNSMRADIDADSDGEIDNELAERPRFLLR